MPYIEKEQNLINDTFIDVRKLFLNILYLVLEKKIKKYRYNIENPQFKRRS